MALVRVGDIFTFACSSLQSSNSMARVSKRSREDQEAAAAAEKAAQAAGKQAAAEPAPSIAEARTMLSHLTHDSREAMLRQLIRDSADARTAVSCQMARVRAMPVDLDHFVEKTRNAMDCGDECRPSRLPVHDIERKVAKVIREAVRLKYVSLLHSFRALAAIAGVVSGAEGELRKWLLGCGNDDTMSAIATAMCQVVDEMGDTDRSALSADIEDLKKFSSHLEDYGVAQWQKSLRNTSR
jgi:hypothetical protein